MRIWFNHWFSTAYHLIGLMRESGPERFTFVGSSSNPYAVYQRACDEWFAEPELSKEEYVDFCLRFCEEHRIDIFVPRRGLPEITENAARFRGIGVRLFADQDARMIAILEEKLRTYQRFKGEAFLPPVYGAHSSAEFDAAYETLQGCCSRVCYKLAVDEGARTFRVIDDRILSENALWNCPGAKVTLDTARRIIAGYDFRVPVLLMPYLSGVEISADCLSTPSGPLVIPRFKSGTRHYAVRFQPEVMKLCARIMDQLRLTMPMNIQFRMEGEKIFLLEINPRMSGGFQLSCRATGINLPGIALSQLLGEEAPWQYPAWNERKVTYIETPVCLEPDGEGSWMP